MRGNRWAIGDDTPSRNVYVEFRARARHTRGSNTLDVIAGRPRLEIRLLKHRGRERAGLMGDCPPMTRHERA